MTGKCGALLHDHGEADVGEWERRRTELDERRARLLADPVAGFYLRHGHPAGRGAQVTGLGETGENDENDENDDPGTA